MRRDVRINSPLRNRCWRCDGVLLRPRLERGQDRRVKRNAARELLAIALHAALARQPHGIASGPRFRLARGIGYEVHLPLQYLETAEGFGLEDLLEYLGAAARRRVGA